MEAQYRFRIRFRLAPRTADVEIDPAEFETTFYHTAAPPGDDGWLFFRNHLWRGSVNDQAHVRELVTESLGVTVTDVEYRAFETNDDYLDAFRAAIAGELETFNAGSVDAVISKYLGSSIERQPSET